MSADVFHSDFSPVEVIQAQRGSSGLRLFTSPSAFPNPPRLRLSMQEKGIADQVAQRLDDMTPVGEQRQWRHQKLNPRDETPTFQLADGSFLSKTAAVVRYLDQSFPARRIMGETPLQQCLNAMWDNPHLGAYPLPDRHGVPFRT